MPLWAQNSIGKFQRGLPVAKERVSDAAVFIRDSVGVTAEALGSDPGDLTQDVPASASFGIGEAINILVTGHPEGARGAGVSEPRRHRYSRPPLIDAPQLTEEQEELLVPLAIVAATILVAPPFVGAGIAAAPILVPLLVITVGVVTFAILWHYMGDEVQEGIKKGALRIQEGKAKAGRTD